MINFTENDKKRLEELALKFLFENVSIESTMGSSLTVHEVLHNVTPKGLSIMLTNHKKRIATLEEADRWSRTDAENATLSLMQEKYEFIDLCLGYNKYRMEQVEIAAKKKQLESQINTLKESQKTPAEKIAELEAELSKL